jgi:hypothetical protein
VTGPPSGHPHDELAVLALDALAGDERAAVEAHVRACPACAAELDDHRQTLALVAVEARPPASTWRSIAEAVAATSNGQGSLPGAHLAVGGPAPTPGPTASTPGPPAGRRRAGGPGDDVAARRARRLRSRRRTLALAAAAAALVVAGAAVGLRASGPGRGGDTDVLAAAEGALRRPGAEVADLTSPEGQVVATVVVEGGDGYALVGDLATLPAGRTYQLWALEGGEATSLGMLGDGTGEAVTVTAAPRDGRRLAISEEPDGGVDSPTGRIVATGTFV